MRRDITLAGFVVTADDWDSLETGVRYQLVSAAHHAATSAIAATIAAALDASAPRFDAATPSSELELDAPSRRAAQTCPDADAYDAYELVDSAA